MNLQDSTIVAIDDTPSILTFLRVSLEDEGAEFFGASNAMDGLKLCKEKSPDLVILDLGLPDVDGLDILPEIKKIPCITMPPIVLILTVRKGRDTINEAYSKGADGYLSKPFVVDDLLETIENALR